MNNQTKNTALVDMKTQIEQLKSKLLDILDLWYYYHNDVYQEIMFKYDNIFGDLEDEIDSKSIAAAELEKKVELLKIKIRKGEEISENTMKFVNLIISRQSNRAEQHSYAPSPQRVSYESDYNSPNTSITEKLKNLRCEVNDNYEIPQLYRNLVKKLHPDVSGETKDFERFWDNVQQAYKSRDIDRLRLLNLSLCELDDYQPVDNNNAEIALKTIIFDLEQNIKKQENKIKNLKNQEPFVFEDRLNDKFWIAKRKNLLRERIFQIDRRIQHHNKLLSSLTSTNPSNQKQFSRMKAV